MLLRLLSVFVVLLIAPLSVHAAEVGDVIPHQLTLQDQSGHEQSFDALKGEKGLVVVFVRSADWCPFCQAQLIDLQAGSELVTSEGYNIATVSYDSVETLKKFSDQRDISLTMLSDPDSEVIRAFDILNDKPKPGSRGYGIPHPTIFVIDTDGKITDILAEEGFKKRPSVEMIAEAIEE